MEQNNKLSVGEHEILAGWLRSLAADVYGLSLDLPGRGYDPKAIGELQSAIGRVQNQFDHALAQEHAEDYSMEVYYPRGATKVNNPLEADHD